jgi:hypothetical protein
MQPAPLVKSILSGLLFSVLAGTAYLVLLHEPGHLFYPFAALCFLCGPLIAGTTGAALSPGHTRSTFLIAGTAVFVITFCLFIIVYAVMPHFDRTSVLLPESCTGFSGTAPAAAAPVYTLPGTGTGVLVASSEEAAVVAMIDRTKAPYPGAVYIVNRTDNRTLRRMDFPDDTIIATVDSGIVYLYNDKLGYILDARTGGPVARFLVIDNYGGLSAGDRPVLAGASEGRRYLETSAVISSWNMDGTVRSRPRFAMNAVAYNCFINGTTGEIAAI